MWEIVMKSIRDISSRKKQEIAWSLLTVGVAATTTTLKL
jgi:hypothetical protein